MEDNLEDEVAMAAMTGTVELTARFCTMFRSKKVVWLDEEVNWACKGILDPGWVSGEKASKWGALEAAAESDAAPGLVSEEKALQAKTSADSFF